MNATGFSEPFIRRPVGTTLLAIGLLLVGAVAYHFLPVASMPTVDYPTISVTASRPGADPETMAATVAAPLERRLGEIPGVTEMTSRSSLGSTRISVQFDLNRNIDGAARDVQAAINAALTDLPQRPAVAAVVPQVQSGGDADHDPGADLEDGPAERALRRRRHRDRRSGCRRSTASPRSASTAPSSRRSASGSTRSRSPRWAWTWRTCAPPSPTPTRPGRSASSTAASARSPSAPTTSCARRRDYEPTRGAHRQRHGGAALRHRLDRAGRAQQPLRRLVQRPALGPAGDQEAGRLQRDRDRRPHLRAAARDQALDPGRHRDHGAVRPHPDHPRQRARHAAHAASRSSSGDAGGVRVPAARRGDASPPASRCRCRSPAPAR